MESSSADYYRGRAKDCCRRAVIAEDVDQRTHWLEAAARWVSLAHQEGVLLPAQTKSRTGETEGSRFLWVEPVTGGNNRH
jgi:hypothetical protein